MGKIEKLTAAIQKTDTANFPGTWSTESRDDGDVLLVWTCEESQVPAMSGDEPWAEWGGNEIIKNADIGDYNDHKSGSDAYQQYGENMVSQWVCFRSEQETKTLSELMAESGANGVIIADDGNGCAYGEDGRVFEYTEDIEEEYGDVEMHKLETVHTSDDGYECEWASEWIIKGNGDNPYRVRLYF